MTANPDTTARTSSSAGQPVPPRGITRARVVPARVGPDKTRAAAVAAAVFGPARRDQDLVHAQPESLAALAKRIRSGDYVAGDKHPGWERVGKAWGQIVAIPVTAACYGLAWLVQQPGRSMVAAALTLVAAGTWFWPFWPFG